MDDISADRVEKRITELEGKIDQMSDVLKKQRFYAQVTFWVTVVVIVGPLIALPFLLSSLTASLGNLGL